MKKLAAAFLTVILVFSLTACSSGGMEITVIYDDVSKVEKNGDQLLGDQLLTVASNEGYSLSIVPDTGYFEVTEKASGYVYASYPASTLNNEMANYEALAEIKSTLVVGYGDTANRITSTAVSFIDSVLENGHTVYKTENGFIEYYSFPRISVVVPVMITLTSNGISAEVLIDQIEEKGDFIVTDISLLKYFGAGGFSDEGYMVVPDGSGAVINFSNGKHTYPAVNIPVYGSDSTLGNPDVSENKAYMPIFGIKNQNHAFLAVIEKGEANANINAAVAANRDAYNRAFASFNVRSSALVGISTTSIDYSSKNFIVFDENKQSLNRISVRYILLSGEDVGYSDMAAAYREYLIKEKGCTEKKDADVPLFLNMVCSVNVDRNIFGVSVKQTVPTAAFADIGDFVDRLSDAGTEDFSVRMESWTKSDVKNKVFKKADALKELGGEKGLKALLKGISDKSVSIYAASDIVHITPSNKYGARNVNRRITEIYPIAWNTMQYDKTENKNKMNLISPVFMKRSSEPLIADAQEKNYGLSLNTSKDSVYSDWGDNYSKRQQSVKYIEEIYSIASGKGVAIGDQKPMAFALPYLNDAFWLGGSYAANDTEDYQIPFYQLAVSGLISYSYEPINLAFDRKTVLMRSLEYGSGLMYTLITQNADKVYASDNTSLYNCIADGLFESIVSNQKQAQDFYDAVGERLVSHRGLAEKVYISEYTNASAIFNYSESEYVYEDKVIEPGSYMIIESGADQ